MNVKNTFLFVLAVVLILTSAPSSVASTKINASQVASAEHYYNEALQEEAAGDLIAALLALRRSLILDPTLTGARQELNKVLSAKNLPIAETWQTRLAAHVSPEKLIIIGALIGWGAAFIAIWIFFTRTLSDDVTSKKRLFLGIALGFFFLGHAMTGLGLMIDPRLKARHEVILMPQKNANTATIPLRATPVDTATMVSDLPVGEQLTLLSRHGVWAYVRTQAGQKGWIPSACMESLIPKK